MPFRSTSLLTTSLENKLPGISSSIEHVVQARPTCSGVRMWAFLPCAESAEVQREVLLKSRNAAGTESEVRIVSVPPGSLLGMAHGIWNNASFIPRGLVHDCMRAHQQIRCTYLHMWSAGLALVTTTRYFVALIFFFASLKRLS